VALPPELARRHQAGGSRADDGDAERARRHQIDREGATDGEASKSLLPLVCLFVFVFLSCALGESCVVFSFGFLPRKSTLHLGPQELKILYVCQNITNKFTHVVV
jgi:hypothetical protein